MTKTSAKKNYYLLVGGAEYLPAFENYLDDDDDWFWTTIKDAKVGESAFIYLTAPVSRIVGRVEIIGEPFFNLKMFEGEKVKNRWMAEVGNVVYFFPRPELTLKGLRRLFPDWGWLSYPRSNTRIPDEIITPFLELMLESNAQWRETTPASVWPLPEMLEVKS